MHFQMSLDQQHQQLNGGGTNTNSVSSSRPVRIEILEPEVKELLESCANYNLDTVRYVLQINIIPP